MGWPSSLDSSCGEKWASSRSSTKRPFWYTIFPMNPYTFINIRYFIFILRIYNIK